MVSFNLSVRLEKPAWLIAIPLAVGMLFLAHDNEVTAETYYYGLALLLLTACVFWLRFRKTPEERPLSFRVLSGFVVAAVCGIFLLYLMGVAAWFI